MLCFYRLLAIKCVSMNFQQCLARPMSIYSNFDEPHYCLFIINMTSDWSCNTVEVPLGRICVPYKMEGVITKVFNIIKRITNELKTLAKCISCKYKCEFVSRKQKWDKNQTIVGINVSAKSQ